MTLIQDSIRRPLNALRSRPWPRSRVIRTNISDSPLAKFNCEEKGGVEGRDVAGKGRRKEEESSQC